MLYMLWPHPISFAAGLSVITVATVFAAAFLVKTMLKQMGVEAKANDYIALSAGALFIASIYVLGIFPHFYNEALATQPWHNATYLLMRLFGALVMGVYI